MDYNSAGEFIAQIVEDENTSEKIANKYWKLVRETIEATDLTHPDTIRLLYPIAAKIVDDNAKFRGNKISRLGTIKTSNHTAGKTVVKIIQH